MSTDNQNYIHDFIDTITKAGMIPANANDIHDTGDTSKLIKQLDDKGNSKSLYYALTITPDKAYGYAHSCKTSETVNYFSRNKKDLTPEQIAQYKAEKAAQQELL